MRGALGLRLVFSLLENSLKQLVLLLLRVVLIIIVYNLDHRVREARQAVLKVAEDSDKDDGIDSLLESGEGRLFILLFDELQLPHSEVAEKKYKS